MRQKRVRQLSIFHVMPDNPIAKELGAISKILDAQPRVLDLVHRDILGIKRSDTGRPGMTAEQALRSAILKQYRSLTYEELAFHLEDSLSFRAFARLTVNQFPSRSVLQENIKAISASTWEAIQWLLIEYAADQEIEKGRKIRIDSTAVESNIHHPTDSSLLQDGVRIMTRLLVAGKDLEPMPEYWFSDHRRVVKKRVITILNARKEKVRVGAYKDLLDVAARVLEYAMNALSALKTFESDDVREWGRACMLREEFERTVSTLARVMDQTERRIIRGEKVPASEKLASFFECHTDIIVKGGRDTEFGHKVFFTGGDSGVIMDCVVARGNPADSAMFQPMIERQKAFYGRVPRQAAADGGFGSKENLKWAKTEGIKDVMFAKRKGLSVLEMVKSNWVYKKLRNFRAGIEANISRLKRAFGLDRCSWTGWAGFRQYVWSAIVSYNLSVLARLKLATA
jgi:IS5 family transposase